MKFVEIVCECTFILQMSNSSPSRFQKSIQVEEEEQTIVDT